MLEYVAVVHFLIRVVLPLGPKSGMKWAEKSHSGGLLLSHIFYTFLCMGY